MRPRTDSVPMGFWRHLKRVMRQVLGAPDYEAYVEHCRRTGHLAVNRADYLKEGFNRKGTTRCC